MKIPTTASQVTPESLRSSVACEQPFVSCLTATDGVSVMSIGIFKVHWATSEHIIKVAPRGGVLTQ